jgi:DNA repair protein RecO (recombination protein O)
MPSTQHFQDLGYVLHSRAYRNSSLIIDVLTREYGRLGLVAKGAKRGNSPMAGRLQAYTRLHMEWGGQHELATLYKAEIDPPGQALLRGEALFHGFYLNELLLRLLHRHDAHPQLFDDYATCLQALVDTSQRDVALRYFELQLLESLGYAMNLDQDVRSGEPVNAGYDYHYLIEQGPVRSSGRSDAELCISGGTLLALAQRTLAQDTHRHQAKLLMRAVLDHYLGPRPLKTRELMLDRKLVRASTPKAG